jgi:hypothetical protein
MRNREATLTVGLYESLGNDRRNRIGSKAVWFDMMANRLRVQGWQCFLAPSGTQSEIAGLKCPPHARMTWTPRDVSSLIRN